MDMLPLCLLESKFTPTSNDDDNDYKEGNGIKKTSKHEDSDEEGHFFQNKNKLIFFNDQAL